jgi:hypothetical protein
VETTYIFPVLIGIAMLAWVFINWRKQQQAYVEHSDKAVGAVATRLGMTVQEGDPTLNLLYFQQPSGDFQRRLYLAGQPYGRPASLTVVDGQKTSEYVVMRRVTQSFGCFLEVTLAVPCPAFEVVLREPNQYLIANQEFAERQELVEASTGSPLLDGHFIVRAQDPRMAPALSSALSLLSTHHFVHLAGEGQRVWMSFSRFGLPSLASAPEEYMLALETAACGLEGKPMPAQVSGVPAPRLP